jgi:DNA-binding MarR family transcriptional regulator
MLTLFFTKRDAMFSTLHEYGLTPPHAHALSVLASGPTRMRDLAEGMACDASYITGIVDRLEEVGLAERRPGIVDRRVKEIALTDRGIEAAARIGSTMSSAPVEFDTLSPAERHTLAKLLAKAVPVASGGGPFKPPPRIDSDQAGRQVSRRPRDP